MQDDTGGVKQLALDAVKAGAAAIQAVQKDGRLDIQTKGSPHDFVTAADKAAEYAIIRTILRDRPDDEIVGEETGRHEGRSGVRWLVDPLDGTLNFVHGRHEYAVSVAAEINDEPAVGAIHRPVLGDWAVADRSGIFWSAGTPSISETTRLSDALIAVHSSRSRSRRLLGFELLRKLLFEVCAFRHSGSAAWELFAVATGALDAYIGIENSPWDVRAGEVLVRAAGGLCLHTRAASGHDILLAGTPDVAKLLVPIVETHR
jgi:myo-inositol-1(or 4)-monophosphatase